VAAYLLPLVAIIVYLGVDASENLERLQSSVGVIVILLLLFVFSRYPRQVRATFCIALSNDGSKVIPTILHEFQKSAVRGLLNYNCNKVGNLHIM
jgi:TRAP-type uncharacterized transport system fused permease subunit